MKGSVVHELDVEAAAGEAWEVYGTLRLAQMVPELLCDHVERVDIEQGDGGAGTVICLTWKPELPGSRYCREKFVMVDNENRVKEVMAIEGGHLDLGFTSYLIRVEILEKGHSSLTIKSVIKYEIDDELAENASFVTTDIMATIAQGVARHLQEKKDRKLAV